MQSYECAFCGNTVEDMSADFPVISVSGSEIQCSRELFVVQRRWRPRPPERTSSVARGVRIGQRGAAGGETDSCPETFAAAECRAFTRSLTSGQRPRSDNNPAPQ